MPGEPNLQFTVENFGPVKSGTFELKPLTIFIGPNNSGKSYMALLVYALAQALTVKQRSTYSFVASDVAEPLDDELLEWLTAPSKKRGRKIEDLPDKLRVELQAKYDEYKSKIIEEIAVSLHDYFGYEHAGDLLLRASGAAHLSVLLSPSNQDTPFLSIQLPDRDSTSGMEIVIPELRLSGDPFTGLWGVLAQIASDDDLRPFFISGWIIERYWLSFLRGNGFPQWSAYYLPSARSGILQGWQIFASMALQVVRGRVGLARVDIPRLSGVAGDFLQTLWNQLSLRPRAANNGGHSMQPALALLEGSIFRGHVSLSQERADEPLMVYRSGDTQLPLQRASSMVAELAPLDLWLKYLIEPGDLLIIDEPEAHLHPENQRLMARVLVRMVRAGVRVVCPTHSSLILHQVSNLILASQLSAEERLSQNLGLDEEDLISREEVGVYLFDLQEDGAHIREVQIDPEFGISEEEFVRVAEAIGEETYKLALATVGGEDGLG